MSLLQVTWLLSVMVRNGLLRSHTIQCALRVFSFNPHIKPMKQVQFYSHFTDDRRREQVICSRLNSLYIVKLGFEGGHLGLRNTTIGDASKYALNTENAHLHKTSTLPSL